MTDQRPFSNEKWRPSPQDIADIEQVLDPPVDRITVMLLKGHAWIDEYLSRILKSVASDTGIFAIEFRAGRERKTPLVELGLEDLNFAKKVEWVRALGLFHVSLYENLRRLNKVRNEYAHQVRRRITRHDFDYIVRPSENTFYKVYEKHREKMRRSVDDYALMVLSFLSSQILGHTVVWSCDGLFATVQHLRELLRTGKAIRKPDGGIEVLGQ